MRAILILLILISLCGCNSQARREKAMQKDLDNVQRCLQASVSLLGRLPVAKTEMAQFLKEGKLAASKVSPVPNDADFSKLRWSDDGSRIKVIYRNGGQNIHVTIGATEVLNADTPDESHQTCFWFSLPNTPCRASVKLPLPKSNTVNSP